MAISYRNISLNIDNFDSARVYKDKTLKIIHYNCFLKSVKRVFIASLVRLIPWHGVYIEQWWRLS